MRPQRTIANVFRKVSLKNQPSDASYWKTRSYEQRIAALEDIRREYHRWTYEIEPRLQRILTIVKR